MTGIIGALKLEIDKLCTQMTNRRSERVGGVEFVLGELCGEELAVAVCGVGKVFAAMCAQAMIMRYAPDRILNIGVGGSLSESLHIGDIVVSDCVLQHDMDTSPLGGPVGMISGINLVKIPANRELHDAVLEAANSLEGIRAVSGTVASGDCFVSSEEKKRFISDTFGASVCEMEGAAIGQVAFVNGVDFCVVRAISDNADGSSGMDYGEFAKLAADNSTRVITRLMESFRGQ